MFFTQEDYKKIEQWLTKNSLKDSEFDTADTLLGNEIIVIVQDGHNRKIYLKDLVNQIISLGVSDFLNVSNSYNSFNLTLEEAIKLIPSISRKKGQVITFSNTEGLWEIYQFTGTSNQWNELSLWLPLLDTESLNKISLVADEEDLTTTSVGKNTKVLSFKDKEYNPGEYSGLGHVILRKNLVTIEDETYGTVVKNILTQDKINKANTIYEIRYDFDLNGEEITIPENCVLKFEGGSLSNGTIDGNFGNYYGIDIIDFESLTFKNFCKYDNGVIIVDKLSNYDTHAHVNDTNNSKYYNLGKLISKCIEESFNKYGKADVIFSENKYYCFASPIVLRNNTRIYGNGCNIEFQTSSTFWLMDSFCAFITNRYNKPINGSLDNYSVDLFGTENFLIDNINFTNADSLERMFGFAVNSERGFIALNTCKNVHISKIKCENIKTPMCVIWINNGENIEVDNCIMSQFPEFNQNGTGAIWTIQSDYIYNLNIHDNNFTFYGDECLNIDCIAGKGTHSKLGLRDIKINNNKLQGAFPIAIYNHAEELCNSIIIEDNLLHTITGVITNGQANPHSILVAGNFNIFSIKNNNIKYDDLENSNTLLAAYPKCSIGSLFIIENINSNNKVSILNSVSSRVDNLNISKNINFLGNINTNLEKADTIFICNNKFRLLENYTLTVPNNGYYLVSNNKYTNDSNENVTILLSGYGKIDIVNNYYYKIEVNIDSNASEGGLYKIVNNSFKQSVFKSGELSINFPSALIFGNEIISQYDAISQRYGKDVNSLPIEYIRNNYLSCLEFAYYTDNMLVYNGLKKLMFVNGLLADKSRPEKIVAGFSMIDTSLSTPKPIWWTGDKWVDATGAAV